MQITQTRFFSLLRRPGRRSLVVLAVCAHLVSTPAARGGDGRDETAGSALSNFTVGLYLLESGRPGEAVAPLSEAWRASREPNVGAALARAYYAVRDAGRADRVAAEVLERDAARVDMLLLRARVSYGRRDVATSIRYLEQARTNGVASFETERLLVSLYMEHGDLQRAIEAADRCARFDPSIPEVHTLRGELLLEAGRPREAETALRTALEMDATEPRALEQLIRLLESEGRLDEALPLLERAVASGDATPLARVRLAGAYLAAERYDDGIRVLEAVRAEGAASDESELLLGRLYFEAGRVDDARALFEALYAKSPNRPELARILGDLSLRGGDTAGARSYFERAIASGPDDYRNYLALFFAQDRRVTQDGARVDLSATEAAALLARASSLAPPDDFDAQFMVGMAFSSVDSLTQAGEHLLRASELKPGDRGAMFNLASVHEKRGDFEGAERILVDLHALFPDDAPICNFYGYLLAEMKKDLDRAETLVRKALAAEPENGFYLDSLGWVYYQQGDYARSVGELERAVRVVPDDPVILEHLGDAYAALSRYTEALAAYRQSSELQSPSASLREKIKSASRHGR